MVISRTMWRALMTRTSRWLGGASYLQRWLILGVLIGTMAGVGAIVFYEVLLASTHFFLWTLAGYHVPTPTGEGGQRASASFARPWALPLVVGQSLPSLYIWLTETLVVSLDLEAAYEQTCRALQIG